MKKANRLRVLLKAMVDGIHEEGNRSDRDAKAMMATAVKKGRKVIKMIDGKR